MALLYNLKKGGTFFFLEIEEPSLEQTDITNLLQETKTMLVSDCVSRSTPIQEEEIVCTVTLS